MQCRAPVCERTHRARNTYYVPQLPFIQAFSPALHSKMDVVGGPPVLINPVRLEQKSTQMHSGQVVLCMKDSEQRDSKYETYTVLHPNAAARQLFFSIDCILVLACLFRAAHRNESGHGWGLGTGLGIGAPQGTDDEMRHGNGGHSTVRIQ